MRGKGGVAVLFVAAGLAAAATTVRADDPVAKSAPSVRAARRAYDGAPPVVPHAALGDCVSCHNERGMEVTGLGFAPATPHEGTRGLHAVSRCRQCHVERTTDDLFRASEFVGLRQDLRRGERFYADAPPVIPHKTFMRENCAACHTGAAAREVIRTSHPERVRCRQCHVAKVTEAVFPGPSTAAPP